MLHLTEGLHQTGIGLNLELLERCLRLKEDFVHLVSGTGRGTPERPLLVALLTPGNISSLAAPASFVVAN